MGGPVPGAAVSGPLIGRRSFVASAFATAMVPFASCSAGAFKPEGPQFTPEAFGARGDGVANDGAAFEALSEAVNRAGGGTVSLRKGATYIVGGQTRSADPKSTGGYTFVPRDVLRFRRCRNAVTVLGNGATLRVVNGYRYGTFDTSGAITRNKMPYFGPQIAAGYSALVFVEECSGPVSIQDLDLDGNMRRAVIGGTWGDAGIQLPGSGLVFRNNTGKWQVRNVRAHDHPLDGLLVDDPGAPSTPPSGSGTSGCDFYENGRQALSLVGGVGHVFADSKFRRTRRGTQVGSPPGAGVDLEAEGEKIVRGIRFERCEMSDNAGPALLHGGGKVSDIDVVDCRVIGTSTWAYYSAGAENMRFRGTTIVGAVVNLRGGPRGELFENCLITNDPALAPRGTQPYSPGGFLIPDGVTGVRIIGGEIRQAGGTGGSNANQDQMLLDGVTIRATRGAIALYGRFRNCRFVEAGGTILALPGGAEGSRNAGNSETAWTLTRGSVTRRFPATCAAGRCPPRKGEG